MIRPTEVRDQFGATMCIASYNVAISSNDSL